ncbi:hypothetical protein TNCV_444841 [Trichonephila clavipes]|nr:hypothetical protein TNCV_444841 [Trichonephila clavipes]
MRERAAQVSSLSLDHDSKLRGQSPKTFVQFYSVTFMLLTQSNVEQLRTRHFWTSYRISTKGLADKIAYFENFKLYLRSVTLCDLLRNELEFPRLYLFRCIITRLGSMPDTIKDRCADKLMYAKDFEAENSPATWRGVEVEKMGL